MRILSDLASIDGEFRKARLPCFTRATAVHASIEDSLLKFGRGEEGEGRVPTYQEISLPPQEMLQEGNYAKSASAGGFEG